MQVGQADLRAWKGSTTKIAAEAPVFHRPGRSSTHPRHRNERKRLVAPSAALGQLDSIQRVKCGSPSHLPLPDQAPMCRVGLEIDNLVRRECIAPPMNNYNAHTVPVSRRPANGGQAAGGRVGFSRSSDTPVRSISFKHTPHLLCSKEPASLTPMHLCTHCLTCQILEKRS